MTAELSDADALALFALNTFEDLETAAVFFEVPEVPNIDTGILTKLFDERGRAGTFETPEQAVERTTDFGPKRWAYARLAAERFLNAGISLEDAKRAIAEGRLPELSPAEAPSANPDVDPSPDIDADIDVEPEPSPALPELPELPPFTRPEPDPELSEVRFSQGMRSPERTLGFLYLADVYIRADSCGPLNAVERIFYDAARDAGELPDRRFLDTVLAAADDLHLRAIAQIPSAVAMLNRLYAMGLPEQPGADVALAPVSPNALAFFNELGFGGDEEGKEGKKKGVGAIVDGVRKGTGAVDAATQGVRATRGLINEVDESQKLVRRKLGEIGFGGDDAGGKPQSSGQPQPAGQPPAATAPPEKVLRFGPKVEEPKANGFVAESLGEKGYRIVIDSIICHEEQDLWTKDDLVFVHGTVILLRDGRILINVGGSRRAYPMNGREEDGREQDPFRCIYPGPSIKNHVHVLEPKEACLMLQADQVSMLAVPRKDFLKAFVTLGVYNAGFISSKDITRISKFVGGGTALAAAYKSGSLSGVEEFVKAVGKVTESIKSIIAKDSIILQLTEEITAEEIANAPKLTAKGHVPLSKYPWKLENRHIGKNGGFHLSDIESIHRGPILHGYRNSTQRGDGLLDGLDPEPYVGTYTNEDKLRALLMKLDPFEDLEGGGSWWTSVRVAFHHTKGIKKPAKK